MLSLKYDHLFLCEFPILTVKLKLGHYFSQFIHKFKIWILKCCYWAVYRYFQVFPNSQKRWKIGIFEKPSLNFQTFSKIHKIVLKSRFFFLYLHILSSGEDSLSVYTTSGVREEEPIYD